MTVPTTSHRRHAAMASALSLPLMLLAALPATAHDGEHDDHTDGGHATYGAEVRDVPRPALRELVRLKGSLARYRSPERAVAEGYLPSAECAASPDGGMGHHYVNPSLMGAVDPARPPVLVYVPGRTGLTLGAVEWFVPDSDQDPGTDGDRPDLLGVPFDGPMPGHEPGMPVHYDLHVWLFEHNPAGLLAPFNPNVRC